MPCNYAEIIHSGWFEVPSSIGVLNFSIATYTKVCLWPRSRATFSVGNMSVNSSWTWDIDSQAGNVIKNEMFQPLDIQTNASYDFQSGEGWFSRAFSRCNLHVRFTEPFSRVLLLVLCLKTNLDIGREPWSSGYGRRLMFQRLGVQIPAPYTGWTFSHLFVVKIEKCVWKDENKWKRGRGWPVLKKETLTLIRT